MGLWGFSSGSIAAIAAAPKANAAFVILASGPAVSRMTSDLEALGPALTAKGFDDAAVNEARTLMRQLWSYYATGEGWDEVRPLVEAAEKNRGSPPSKISREESRRHATWRRIRRSSTRIGPSASSIQPRLCTP